MREKGKLLGEEEMERERSENEKEEWFRGKEREKEKNKISEIYTEKGEKKGIKKKELK